MSVDFIEIGSRVSKRRKILNLTQEELAEKADLSTTHIQNIERASSKCSINSLMKLSIALQVTPDYLLSGTYVYMDEPKLDMIKAYIMRCNTKHFDLIINFIAWVADQDIK